MLKLTVSKTKISDRKTKIENKITPVKNKNLFDFFIYMYNI